MDFFGINLKADVTAEGTPDLGTIGNPMGILHGEATSAQWADLAEKYTCKGECVKGTVMCVSKDVEADMEPSSEDLPASIIGVISTQPGFKMNDNLLKGNYVGLTGRLPVRVVGAINKGDFIVATKDGCARAGKSHEIAHKIGVSNETNSSEEIKLVECVIK
jgi:hypothetical protein